MFQYYVCFMKYLYLSVNECICINSVGNHENISFLLYDLDIVLFDV